MKMNNNYILKLNELVKLLWIIILLGACQSDESYSVRQDDPVLVKLSVSASGAGTVSGSGEGADAITSIYILQFNAEGESYGTLRYVSEGKKNTSGNFTANLLQSMGANDNYKLVILANLPDYGFLYGLYGKSDAEVQQACLSAATTDPLVFDATHPFPMFGVVNGGTSVQVQDGTVYNGTTELIRAVARVDIGIGTKQTAPDGTITSWTNTGSDKQPFVMTEVQVWRSGQKYAYMPATGNYSWTTAAINSVTSKKIVIDRPSVAPGATTTKTYGTSYITDGTYCLGKIYLPEADLLWGNGGEVYDTNHANRLAIIVGGMFNGFKRFYRLDFTNDQTGVKMDILRNHVYQFTISRVTDEGYDSAREAYEGTGQGLSFITSIENWISGITAKPLPQEGYLMSYGGQSGNITSGEGITIKKKSTYWEGENSDNPVTVDYNTFYGEVPGNLKRSPAYPNGDIYPDIATLTKVEGAYPLLMVATDDIYTATGTPNVPWKDGLEYTAFDLCHSYAGLGYSDWRLPRASELALMYLNRHSLEKQRGFTAFSGTYWSGSEKGNPTDPVAAAAWTVNFDGTPRLSWGNKATGSYKVRCVRQISDTKKK